MSKWITIEAQRVLYVDRGRDVILCDRGHPGPVTLVLKLEESAVADEWNIVDSSSTRKGYLTLAYKGVRVCDFFPFAKDADEALVRQQAQLIAATMNEAEELRRLAADQAVSDFAIGIRIRNTYHHNNKGG